MAKVIKGSGAPTGQDDLGVVSPDTGFAELPRKKPAIVSKEEFEAGSEARKIVSDAELKAQGIIAEAQSNAEQILTEARAQAQKMKAAANEQGFAEGSNKAAAEYTEIISQHAKRMEQKETEVAGQIRQLSLAIAKKIIGKELEFNPDAVVEMAKKHLSTIRQRREVFLRVSPSDIETMREHRRELIDQLGRAKEIEIKADETLSPGSMIIETDAGTIDAKLETQLAVIEKVLLGRPAV